MLQLTGTEAAKLARLADELEPTDSDLASVLRRLLRESKPPKGYLTTGQAARLLDVTSQTVRNWADRGWLASERARPLGRRHIEQAAVDRMLAFRAAVRDAGVPALTDDEIDRELAAHRQERSKSETGEPLAGGVHRGRQERSLVGSA